MQGNFGDEFPVDQLHYYWQPNSQHAR